MDETTVLCRVQDHVATVTINRPAQRNAYDPATVCRLADLWQTIAADPAVRVVILTGAGDRAFCAGADLKRLIPLLTGARQPEDEHDRRVMADRQTVARALLRAAPLDKPVIAAVNGPALAGGCLLALATDLRLAATHATFGVSEAQRGLPPAGGGMVDLPRQIPYAIAMEMLLTGEPISAQRAYASGLVNAVVAPDQLLAKAERLAARLAANGPLALAAIKRVVRATSGRPLDEAAAIEWRESLSVLASEDAREGPRAFLEKRAPRFTGR
ncbi:MAG: crotonase/enoyl-CoA hydratase family protein [Alphaproteobacteria bacterium]|nr:crotonase/enoyl-CoA hydratase family protein [Alphaproteobacteria bacterium]